MDTVLIEQWDHKTDTWTSAFPAVPSMARAFLADKDERFWRAVSWPSRQPVDIWAPSVVRV